MAREDGSLAQLNNDALGICIIGRRQIHEAVRLHTLSWLMKDKKITMDCAHEGTCSGHKNDLSNPHSDPRKIQLGRRLIKGDPLKPTAYYASLV